MGDKAQKIDLVLEAVNSLMAAANIEGLDLDIPEVDTAYNELCAVLEGVIA
jgi:hypothetical protein